MANLKLDNTLAGALSTIVERYKDDNQFVFVENADKLAFDELERMGYLKNLSYDLSGNAIMTPTYKAAAYFQEENGAAIVVSRNNKVFETFGETYTRVKGIGNGGAGNVYEVAASDGERYALKLLNAEAARNPSKLKRFLQEARYELEGKCSAVVKAVDLGSIGFGNEKRPFYVMPLMDSSLDGLMKRAEEFSAGALAEMVLTLMDELRPFYRDGNFHRDIKPQNLLYDASSNRLLLSDLGIAHIEEGYPGATVETVASDRLANFQYAAPEQRVKGGSCDQRTDIYAFGLILNELFTAAVPQGANYRRISDVDGEYAFLDRVVERMIAQNPDDRYPSIEAVLLDVEALSSKAAAEAAAHRALENVASDEVSMIRVVGKRWENGAILFEMSDRLQGRWLDVFRSYGQTSFCTDGFHLDPKRFVCSGSTLTVPKVGYDKVRAKEAVGYVDKVVDWANGEYARMVRRERQREHEEKLARRRAELERAEKDAEFASTINDMLANM